MLTNPKVGDVIYYVHISNTFIQFNFILVGSITSIKTEWNKQTLTFKWNKQPSFILKYHYAKNPNLFSTMKGATNYLSKKCDSLCNKLEKDIKKLNHDYAMASQMIYKCSQRPLECLYEGNKKI